MNCKIKLHSKGFYKQIFWAVPVLKFLQTLALDFPHINFVCNFPGKFQLTGRKILTDKCIDNLKKWFQCMQLHVTSSNFLSTIHIFSGQPLYENYFTLDSQTNTVISHVVGYSSRRLPKLCQGLLEAEHVYSKNTLTAVFKSHLLGDQIEK